MLLVESISVPYPATMVMASLWSLDALRTSWPSITHLELMYEDDKHQDAWMHVDRDGNEERLRVVRFRREHVIEFFNPTPPPQMTAHSGAWEVFAVSHDATQLVATRNYELRREPSEQASHWLQRRDAFHRAFAQRLAAILRCVAAHLRPDSFAISSQGSIS